ncbi:hypothetical protein D8674_012316 [Pyrus ussuriensis x Pyrus communis]|uniref:Uncharacterized protein n=1 Tax=Pyrus ussuriensis x Pyrus communis TaxID=2448454 RepID=A0A5N5G169_9ROSA|nr:hypothetical protein D8674_012316 [Pyrus ussuriensis x Pyrus communis]
MSQLITRRRGVTNAPPTFSAPTASAVSAPLIGEPTSLIEATPRASQVPASSTSSVSIQPLSAQRPHRRRHHLKPSDHTSSTSTIEGGGSQPAEKNTKGPNRMLKPIHNVRMSKKMIKIAYDSRHRGAATSQQHSSISTSCSFVLDQKLGHHHGKVVRGMGKVRVREMGAASSRPTTRQVIALTKEVETLKAKIAAQGDKLAAQGEKIAAQGEKIAAQGEKLSMILRALQMSGLQIPMPTPNLAPPSTS